MNKESLKFSQIKSPLLATHRGYGKLGPIAENTLPAFLAAQKEGFEAHELDVRRTKDNVAVLFHGPFLEKTSNGYGRIEEKTFEEVSQLNFAKYIAQETFTPITRLDEYLSAMGTNTISNIEIKRDKQDKSLGLEEAVLEAIQKTDSIERVFVSSFNPFCLKRMQKLDHSLPLGLLIEPTRFFGFFEVFNSRKLKLAAIHPHYSNITRKRVRRWHSKGLKIATWTVNDISKIRQLCDWGVDIIITDNIPAIHLL